MSAADVYAAEMAGKTLGETARDLALTAECGAIWDYFQAHWDEPYSLAHAQAAAACLTTPEAAYQAMRAVIKSRVDPRAPTRARALALVCEDGDLAWRLLRDGDRRGADHPCGLDLADEEQLLDAIEAHAPTLLSNAIRAVELMRLGLPPAGVTP